ncbi:MAG: hypothetical protein Ct9H300mP3_03750 [Gammaproteobacteria bacterium]|nr:MAG: hypothetical protein Ct9H300mP3_03750 [Gammaproteobacteria bacterium]
MFFLSQHAYTKQLLDSIPSPKNNISGEGKPILLSEGFKSKFFNKEEFFKEESLFNCSK